MAFTPADPTLSILKATQDFTATTNNPTNKYLVNIRKVMKPVLTKFNMYDQLNNQYSLARVILTEYLYKHIYKHGPYVILPEVSVYDVTIDSKARKKLSIEQNWRMKPNAPTQCYTMQPTLVVSTSSCPLLTRHCTRNWKMRTHSTQM